MMYASVGYKELEYNPSNKKHFTKMIGQVMFTWDLQKSDWNHRQLEENVKGSFYGYMGSFDVL